MLGLQEASVVGMADGHAQAMNLPAVSVLHTDVGTGNAMGNIITAYLNRSPLIVIAGQQTREMLIGDPFLTDREAINLPKPYIKWSYEPYRAEDVPAALVSLFYCYITPFSHSSLLQSTTRKREIDQMSCR